MRTSTDPQARAYRQNCRAYVACPHCGAEPGQKCIGARGQPRYSSHVERWEAFDPTYIAARSARADRTFLFFTLVLAMAHTPDAFDMDEAAERAEPEDVTCNRCGEGGLHWQRVTLSDGRSEASRLFNDAMQRHVCKPSRDEFVAIP